VADHPTGARSRFPRQRVCGVGDAAVWTMTAGQSPILWNGVSGEESLQTRGNCSRTLADLLFLIRPDIPECRFRGPP
jgi:hypothetical protein